MTISYQIKINFLKECLSKFNLKVFIETGTQYGDMVYAISPFVEKVYSIELSRDLYYHAKRRFADNPKIELIHGDSGIELENLLRRMKEPALFWLDAHYSGGVTDGCGNISPILKELAAIFRFSNRESAVVIDDFDCFGQLDGFPTKYELLSFLGVKDIIKHIDFFDQNNMHLFAFSLPEINTDRL